jgi:hypothetical protein
MEAARDIRDAVARVTLLRQAIRARPELGTAVAQVKRFQSRRFAGTYADLLAGGPFAAPSRFFLEELYSDKDYAERDAQFARIAGAIERFFPEQVARTAVALAQLHAVTEELDQAMASEWLGGGQADERSSRRYINAWRAVDRRAERMKQLTVVLGIGHDMARLTRTPGLRTMLKMMRGPASAAGLSSLQRFLESGFDTFGAMARTGAAADFLRTIEQREGDLIAALFDMPLVACETQLDRTLGQAP